MLLLGDNEETTLGLLLLLLPLLLLRLLLLLLLLLLLMPHQWLPILPHRRHSRCLFSPLPLLPPQLLPLISSSPEYYHFGGGKRRGKRNPPRLRWTARRRHRLPSMVVADQHPLGDGSESRSCR